MSALSPFVTVIAIGELRSCVLLFEDAAGRGGRNVVLSADASESLLDVPFSLRTDLEDLGLMLPAILRNVPPSLELVVGTAGSDFWLVVGSPGLPKSRE